MESYWAILTTTNALKESVCSSFTAATTFIF